MTILVTGAAGTLGRLVVDRLVHDGNTVRAFDNHEAGLAALDGDSRVRLVYGDIRDAERVRMAMRGVTHVIHCAAIKNLVVSEKNPWEAIRTNIEGTYNVGFAALEAGVSSAIFISSDKAVAPRNLYGATKLIGEQVWQWFAYIQEKSRFAVLRSGNFRFSQGSVREIWRWQHEQNVPLTVTDTRMVRYFIDADDVAGIAVEMLAEAQNGEIYIPAMEEESLMDLKKRLYPVDEIRLVGLRKGEKLEEQLENAWEYLVRTNEKYRVMRP